jgi:PAS domain S-box-containing protein
LTWQGYFRLRNLTADNHRQQNNLRDLATLLQNEMAIAEQTIVLVRGGNTAEAIDIVRSGEGKRLMDNVRQVIKTVITEEQRLLQELRDQAQRLANRSTQTFVALGTLMIIGLLLSGVMLVRAMIGNLTKKRMMAEAAGRQRLFDMVNVAAVMMREVDGTIHFWSEGCRRLYGWTAEQAIGRSSHELLQTVFPLSLAEVDATLLRHGAWNGELRHRTRDGKEVIVSASKTLHDYADGSDHLVVETLTDLTALHRAQVELQKSEAQFSALVDTAADGFVIASSGGQIQSVNRAMLSMFGYDQAEELIGRNLRMLMPAVEGAQHDSYIAAHRAGAPPG